MTASKPTHKHPVLLFPLRLETRFSGHDLLVRVYPDDVLVHAHDKRLSPADSEALDGYRQAREIGGDDAAAAAWRGLVARVGARRAAYLASLPKDVREVVADTPFGGAPRATLLPNSFAAYLYDPEGHLAPAHATWTVSPEARQLSLLANPDGESAGGDATLFAEKAAWISDFAEAERLGLAVKIPGVGDRYSRLIVIGLNNGSAEQGASDLTELIEAHRFSSGIGLVPYGTPTNNTADARSGYWDDEDDAEQSFAVECADSSIEKPTLGGRLAKAFGLDCSVFQNIAHAGDSAEPLGKAARTLLWPALGDYFLQHMLSEKLSDGSRAALYEHFRDFVDARGPLPTIRVGKQPYGVVPVTGIRSWQPSSRDQQASADAPSSEEFDEALHKILGALFDRWLAVTNGNAGLVPRIGGTSDPDQELLQILGMQPASVDVHLRRVVDDRFMGWVFAYCGDQVIRDKTGPNCATLEECTEFWVKQFRDSRNGVRTLLNQISAKLGESKILDVYGWGEASTSLTDLGIPLVGDGEDDPLGYIKSFENRQQDATKPLLYDLLRRAEAYRESSIADGEAETNAFNSAVRNHFDGALNIAGGASVIDLENAVRDALDLHGHRLDAWITSLATRRLLGMRRGDAESSFGICTGAYGWVTDLQRAERWTGDRAGGYIHAPSCAQAAAAAVLRNAYITHADDEKGNAYRINLSS